MLRVLMRVLLVILAIVVVPLLTALALAILLVVILLLLLLSPLRLQVMAQYDQGGPAAAAWVGLFRVFRFPGPKKVKKPKKKKPKKEKAQPEVQQEPEEAGPKGQTKALIKEGLALTRSVLGQVRRRLVIREFTFHYTIASGDAAKTALTYGRMHGLVGTLLSFLRTTFRVKKQDVRINADFEREKSQVLFRIRLSISIWGLLCLGLYTLIKGRGLIRLLVRGRRGKKRPIQKGEQHGQASHQ